MLTDVGQGWYTMADGAWRGLHGITINAFLDDSQSFTTRHPSANRFPASSGLRLDECPFLARTPGGQTVVRPDRGARRLETLDDPGSKS
jgi:hypothetical protein